MQINVGVTDRAVRIWSGAVLGPTAIGTLLGLLPLPTSLAPVCGLSAIYLFTTALSRRCPVFYLLRINSRTEQPSSEQSNRHG